MNRLLSPLLVLLVFGLIAASPTAYAASPPDQWVPAGLQEQYVRFLAIDPLTPSTLYAGAGLNPYHGWLFKTIGSGTNWTQTTFYSPSAIIIDPQTPSTLYVSDGDQNVVGFPARSRISKSLDRGGALGQTVVTAWLITLMLPPLP